MSVIDSLLQHKPLGSWQQQVFNDGRYCNKCGSPATITAPVTDNDKMLRISCPKCGNVSYEFAPENSEAVIIDFNEIKQRGL